MYGLESLDKLLKSMDPNSLIAKQMLGVKVTGILKRACQTRRLHIDFQHNIHVECASQGIIINTTSATIANRLKQIQPTLEKALFDSGLNLPIQSIRAGKIQPLAGWDEYPKDAPRIAQPGTSEAVLANAMRAEDLEIRESLKRLANALDTGS